jgi:glycosyltransferase involved in cell wall biosynthesis
MKIGIDARFWHETGVGRYITNLVLELERLDTEHEFVLFVKEQDYKEIRQLIKSKKFKVVPTAIHWHSVREQIAFSGILHREKLDLMHFPYFSVPIFYSGKFVVTIHDLIIHHFVTGEATTLPFPLYRMKVGAYKYVISSASKRAARIIAVSEATKQEVIDHLHVSPDKVVVTYEGIDPALSKTPDLRPKKDYGKYFLHVGNVYPHKNAKRLVEAFEFVHGDDVRLIFAGKKDYFMNRLEKFVKEKNIDNIEFIGFVPDEELGNLYRNALATVVPSLMEGFGLPVLEALANKSLVLASDISSLKEVGKDAVIYVDPFNITSLSAKMQHIAQEEPGNFESLKLKGLQIVKEFSWKEMTELTIRVYESSLSARSD